MASALQEDCETIARNLHHPFVGSIGIGSKAGISQTMGTGFGNKIPEIPQRTNGTDGTYGDECPPVRVWRAIGIVRRS